MEYNPEVWNSLPALKANFPKMAQKITSTGGQAVLKSDLTHVGILQSILKKLNT